jgi:amidohydrolase
MRKNDPVDIKSAAIKIQEEIVNWRRDLHRIPELSFELHRTAEYLKGHLDKMKIPWKSCAKTGIVALIRGESTGPVIALRADMDALEIREETGLPFAAENGHMHACGHDAHMAILLGAAKIISAHRDKLKGNVKLIFQPAEEAEGGAEPMIREGCLEEPLAAAVFGLHIGHLFPEVGPGQIGVSCGPVMAASSVFSVTVKGKSAHVGTPHTGVDALTAAAEMILSLQKIVSLELEPGTSIAVAITRINGGKSLNALCDEVTFDGDLRTVYKEDERYIKQRISEICRGIADANRCEAKIEFIKDFPAVVNDETFTEKFVKSAAKIVGEQNIMELKKPSLGNDDIAYFLEMVPGAYFFLGSYNPEKGPMYPHHHPKFDIDESVLWIGSAVLAQAAFDFTESK